MKHNSLFVLLCVSFVTLITNGGATEQVGNVNQKGWEEKNYVFIPEANGVYKLHTTRQIFNDAKTTCKEEGAGLYYPETEKEFNAVVTFMKNKYKELFPNEIHIGIERFGSTFKTINGISLSYVYTKWGNGEPNNVGNEENCVMFHKTLMIMNDIKCSHAFGFICRSPNTWNEECHMFNEDYGYNEEMGKCYKFHLMPKTWTEAQAICQAERSQLAVINSQEEATYLVRLTRSTLRNIPGSFTHGVVLLGFHNNNVEDWQTIDGTSLYYSGYACWGNSQPDGGERDRCGSMFYNGHLNDIACDQKAFFICEHDNTALNYVHEPRSFYNVIQSLRCYDTI